MRNSCPSPHEQSYLCKASCCSITYQFHLAAFSLLSCYYYIKSFTVYSFIYIIVDVHTYSKIKLYYIIISHICSMHTLLRIIYYIHTSSTSCSGQWQHGNVCTLVMQQPIAACTRAQSLTRPCPCATCNWLLHPAPTSAQDGFDPLQLALVVVFILPSSSIKTSLALAVCIMCNLRSWCFSCAN